MLLFLTLQSFFIHNISSQVTSCTFTPIIELPSLDRSNTLQRSATTNMKTIGSTCKGTVGKLILPLSFTSTVLSISWVLSKVNPFAGILYGTSVLGRALVTYIQLQYTLDLKKRVVQSLNAERVEIPSIAGIFHEVICNSKLKTNEVSTYIVPTSDVNAFAFGPTPGNKDCAIFITQGLLNSLSSVEIKAVIAHECGHICNKDFIRSIPMIAVISGFDFVTNLGQSLIKDAEIEQERIKSNTSNRSECTWISELFHADNHTEEIDRNDSQKAAAMHAMGVSLVAVGSASCIVGILFEKAFSREMEFQADAHATRVVSTSSMIFALKALSCGEETKSDWSDLKAFSTPLNPHSLRSMCIVDKQSLMFNIGSQTSDHGFIHRIGRGIRRILNVFSTHPLIEERITALMATENHCPSGTGSS